MNGASVGGMRGRVAGKKIFITGAAQGIGAASARLLAAHGAVLALTDINVAGARTLSDDINRIQGHECSYAFQLDVRREEQWIDVLKKANQAMGGINVLVNNAGIIGAGNIEELSFEKWKQTHEVNVDSVFLSAKHGIAYLRNNQPASIVNLSSIAGLIAAHNLPAYNASKAGVWLLSKGIALHCAKEGLDVRSNTIHPAFVDTPILDEFRNRLGAEEAIKKLTRQIPLGRLGEPDDIAYAVLYLASDESRFMTGAELKLDGGISAM